MISVKRGEVEFRPSLYHDFVKRVKALLIYSGLCESLHNEFAAVADIDTRHGGVAHADTLQVVYRSISLSLSVGNLLCLYILDTVGNLSSEVFQTEIVEHYPVGAVSGLRFLDTDLDVGAVGSLIDGQGVFILPDLEELSCLTYAVGDVVGCTLVTVGVVTLGGGSIRAVEDVCQRCLGVRRMVVAPASSA